MTSKFEFFSKKYVDALYLTEIMQKKGQRTYMNTSMKTIHPNQMVFFSVLSLVFVFKSGHCD